jgi:SRSO17 transposase
MAIGHFAMFAGFKMTTESAFHCLSRVIGVLSLYQTHIILMHYPTSDEYKSKPQLAVESIREIQAMGFVIERVLADSLYGESGDVTGVLHQLKLPYIVAIRSNHGVLLPKGQRVRYNRWRAYDQPLDEHPTQRRYIREIIFGTRRSVRFYQITKGSTDAPDKVDTWFIMTNLTGDIILSVGSQYTLRTWIEYGFKQVKNRPVGE